MSEPLSDNQLKELDWCGSFYAAAAAEIQSLRIQCEIRRKDHLDACKEIDTLRTARATLTAERDALKLLCVEAAVPLEALRIDNEAGSQLIASQLRVLIQEVTDKVRAALAGEKGAGT